ncbi:MAG: DUF2188 domain-containing protein [Myxococcota bacterium]
MNHTDNHTYRVVPFNGSWALVSSAKEQPLDLFDRKQDAVEYGNAMAKANQARIVIHRQNGTFQLSHTYSGDASAPYWINNPAEELPVV